MSCAILNYCFQRPHGLYDIISTGCMIEKDHVWWVCSWHLTFRLCFCWYGYVITILMGRSFFRVWWFLGRTCNGSTNNTYVILLLWVLFDDLLQISGSFQKFFSYGNGRDSNAVIIELESDRNDYYVVASVTIYHGANKKWSCRCDMDQILVPFCAIGVASKWKAPLSILCADRAMLMQHFLSNWGW